jgi:adenine-specific DNA-methyltransferase
MAYLKQWAARAHNDLELRVPDLVSRAAGGKGEAFELDAAEAAETIEAEVAYLDPPYNQHKYLGNYHIWESLVRGDTPEVYGIACKRVDCRTRGSAFNAKPAARAALQDTLRRLRVRHVIVSFSDEGYIARADLEAMLWERGEVLVVERDHARHVGARIGIYDLKGKKVGTPGKLRNTERIYIASWDDAFLARIRALGATPSLPT